MIASSSEMLASSADPFRQTWRLWDVLWRPDLCHISGITGLLPQSSRGGAQHVIDLLLALFRASAPSALLKLIIMSVLRLPTTPVFPMLAKRGKLPHHRTSAYAPIAPLWGASGLLCPTASTSVPGLRPDFGC